jgi:hypothetical protein
VNSSVVRAAVIALVALGAARADAQITTVITPPKQTEAKSQALARRAQVAQDSVARVTLTEMKQWVDSAAASLALRPDSGTVPPDSSAAARAAQQPFPPGTDSAAARRRVVEGPPEFREGARAPNTATNVPTLALLGVAMIAVGFALRKRLLPIAEQRRKP